MIHDTTITAAPAENSLISSNARITAVTPRILRFEWSPDGIFDDRRTQNIDCRDFGACPLRVTRRDGAFRIDTGKLLVVFRPDDQPFGNGNLRVEWQNDTGSGCWTPGMRDTGNLKGAFSQLDMLDGDELLDLNAWLAGERKVRAKLKVGDGFLSRSGWSVFDDSRTAVLTPGTGLGTWYELRPAEEKRQDFYFFGFGHDYKGGLGELAGLFGRQPLPPAYAFGYWFSRYWAYSDRELMELTEHFEASGVPLDVLVLDLDWHLPGWTGFTWDHAFFHNPDAFLADMKKRKINIALNLHPDRGIAPHEKQYREFAAALPCATKQETIPFALENPDFMDLYFKKLLNPEEDRGVAFWWMDWRQNEDEVERNGFSPLSWIQRLHWQDQLRRHPDRRPMVFGCRGGADSGRYPVGFSADACCSWATLAKEVELTAQSANVLFGYWSHDIGGHMQHEALAPSLYLRWMQFGMCSPIFRTHSAKFAYAERRFWNFPEPYSTMFADTIRRRYRMMPYLYTESRKCFDTGISLCRPLYFDYPDCEEAYQAPGEYNLGDSLLAAPITAPPDPETELTRHAIWLPPGEWYDTAAGAVWQGPCRITCDRLLDEVPLFARSGAILPERLDAGPIGDTAISRRIAFGIYPGAAGEYELYEDDGTGNGYRDGECVRTRLRHRKEGSVRRIEWMPSMGNCRDWPERRDVSFILYGVVPPAYVQLDGCGCAWEYDAECAACRISLPNQDTRRGGTVEIGYEVADEFAGARFVPAIMRRLDILAKIQNGVAGCAAPVKDDRLAQQLVGATSRMEADPKCFGQELALIRRDLPKLRPAFDELARVRGKLFPFNRELVAVLLDDLEKMINSYSNTIKQTK